MYSDNILIAIKQSGLAEFNPISEYLSSKSQAYSQVLVSFINKLVSLEEKNSHMGQNPMSTRGDPDIEETVTSDGEDPLGMPKDMEGADRTPTRVQPIPEDVQGEYLKRTPFFCF